MEWFCRTRITPDLKSHSSAASSWDNPVMLIGDRLCAFREAKKLSQGDIEERTGLLRSYISRVENGHTTPSVETLEKWARALEVPLYQLFYEGKEPPKLPHLRKRKTSVESHLAVRRKRPASWRSSVGC
jgi:transcriptional regulator with XRE-family HTH domain